MHHSFAWCFFFYLSFLFPPVEPGVFNCCETTEKSAAKKNLLRIFLSDKFTSHEVYVIFIYIMYHISERKTDMKKNDDYIKRAAAVVPSERQLKWHELEFYAFIHFGMNTFTNSEWGNGNDDPVLFNPEKLNANQ